LLRYRVAAGLTQEQLAAQAAISPAAVATLEQGKRRSPRASTVRLLADALTLGDAARAELCAAARPVPTRTVTTDGEADTQTAQSPLQMAAQPTPLVDRADELETILQRLTIDGVRLLTLVGPAGVGKTRLALATVAAISSQAYDPACDHFPDGVVWVDLTPIRDPRNVLGTIGRAFGFTDTGLPPLGERLVGYLLERALLLVLDNFEQVLPAAAATLANLLGACPHLALLVTSRVPLQLRWEQSLRVAPLPVPDLSAELPPVDALLTVPSVELFVGRARTHRADFALTAARAPLVAQLAVQLDGLPLALELAAARLDVLSLPILVRRLGDRLRLLASEAPDLPERQRSLAAAVGWSYDLLSEPERRLFRCLGVFVGWVTLDAITMVARVVGAAARDGEAREATVDGRTLQRLISLAEKSLILPARSHELSRWPGHDGEPEELEDDDPGPAFGMLETVREYAWEQLAAQGELEAARRAHAHYFLALAERAEPGLRGHNQRAWYFRLEREQDNLRAALRWLLDQDGPDAAERTAGLRLAGALGWFWRMRGYHEEGWRWLEEALARAPQAEGAELAVRTRALAAAVALLALQGDFARARSVAEEGLALAEQQQDDTATAAILIHLGLGAVIAGEVQEGTRRLNQALRRWEALSDPEGLGETQLYLGYAADMTGDVAAAAAHYADALGRLGAAGDADAQLAGFVHCYLGVIEWKRGHLRSAVEQVQAALQTSVALCDRWLLSFGAQAALAVLGEYAEPARRARLLGATDALRQAAGDTYSTYSWEHLPATHEVVGLRERLAREGWGAAYQEGRSLPFGEVAALALNLLADVAKALSRGVAGVPAAVPAIPDMLPQTAATSRLSEREREVLRLVAQGLSSKAIGRQLFLSPSTVNHHLKSVFNKLAVDTRAQAVAVAAQLGLFSHSGHP
jgi:predicted ATPase/DNA-binding CsgD family transcriptional regulator